MDNRSLFDGENIVLTAIDPEKDAATYSRWSLDSDLSRELFEGFYRPRTAFAVKKQLKEDLKKAEEKRNPYFFGIREKDKDALAGLVIFPWVQTASQVGYLRLVLDGSSAVAGYPQEVLKLALRFAFMELSLHRLCIHLPGYKEAEIRLYEGAGFLRESQRRQAIFHDGRLHDEVVYGLLRSEWKQRNMEVSS